MIVERFRIFCHYLLFSVCSFFFQLSVYYMFFLMILKSFATYVVILISSLNTLVPIFSILFWFDILVKFLISFFLEFFVFQIFFFLFQTASLINFGYYHHCWFRASEPWPDNETGRNQGSDAEVGVQLQVNNLHFFIQTKIIVF